MIQKVLRDNGVPQDLIYQAVAESGFQPQALNSRSGAGGMWQFMPFAGAYGLERNGYFDERFDPQKSTVAYAKYMKSLYDQFGDWYLAMAAYNCGPVNVEKAVERTGYADFWELRRLGALPAETTNYVPIILAMTIMEKNAAEYGLQDVQFDPPLGYDSVDIAAPTSLALVSDITGVPVSELAALNPAILKSVAPAGYALHVPKGAGSQLMVALQLVPSEHRDLWRMHSVGAGETLASIGKLYGIGPGGIAAANGLHAAEPAEGDRLLIPAIPRAPAAPVRHVASHKPAGKAAVHASAKTPVSKGSKAPVATKPAHKKQVVVASAATR
jgi:membrane-bound lytic murein transglycosylase D